MAWTRETKMGFAWATVVVLLFLVAVAAMGGAFGSAFRTPGWLLLPTAAFIGFLGMINRVK